MTTISVSGIPQLQRRLEAISHGRPLLQDIQIRTVREAKIRVARATGNTGRTIRPGDLTDSFTIVEAGGAAVYLEFGTKPHRIPKAGNARRPMPLGGARRLSGRLRSGAKPTGVNGGPPFAWHVQHPGTKAQPFLLPGAVEAVKQVGVKPIVDAWNDAA